MTVRPDPKRCPTHPGVVLADDVLPSLGLSVKEAAAHLGVTRQALHRVLAGTAAISPAMAVRLGKLFGTSEQFWLNMQAAHDLWHAKRQIDVSSIPTLKAARACNVQ